MTEFTNEEILKFHDKGKIALKSTVPLKTRKDLSIAYTPGVALPCKEIEKDESKAYDYTAKGNWVAVVTDGSAVLGLGNIGARAALPVMEGKAILFKEFGDVDAFPICLDTQNPKEIIQAVKMIAPVFGGINLEDISSPRCFEIENALKKELDIPVFHDDQHGTAIVTLAALINSLKLTGKKFEDLKIVISGAGAAGIAVTEILLHYGSPKDIILCDRGGALFRDRDNGNPAKQAIAEITNKDNVKGSLRDALKRADVFIGLSAPNLLRADDISNMNSDAIVFAMSNPVPEIMPDEAKKGGAVIVGTGRSDFPNQINNVLAFPGVFRGALDSRAKHITMRMKVAAAEALAGYVTDLSPDKILPDPLDKNVGRVVGKAVAEAVEC